uniref:V-set immunoregulatory receptor n=1 Tax=Lepisosteus oculatus TaxID=7918 RepID=W5MQE0_LEPOC
ILWCSFLCKTRVIFDHTDGIWSMTISAPYESYYCPEGANVTLICTFKGEENHLGYSWYFTPHLEKPCEKIHPRQPHNRTPTHGHSHGHGHGPGVLSGISKGNLTVSLINLTQLDQGRYCCILYDKNQHHILQHSFVRLLMSPRNNNSHHCTTYAKSEDDSSTGSATAAGLATAACIIGILALPLILLLVYKQRQTVNTNRRAQELVRMDSAAQGHENPVFLGESPQVKTRTVSQIMRQQSETGRHLLSEPGTPLSPPPNGDVFFPSQDPIPESPDL